MLSLSRSLSQMLTPPRLRSPLSPSPRVFSCDVDAVPFARDVGAFLIALTAILLMISIPDPDGGHSVTLIEAIILILVYVGYVVIVVAADYIPMDAIKAKLGCGPKFTQRGGDIHRCDFI